MNKKELRLALQDKIDNLNKPKGSLGRLEELALQIGLIQGSLSPTLHRPFHILIGADHGIEREGVSVSPREITWQQMINFTRGGGGVNMFARQHHFELILLDAGVDYDLTAYPTIHNCKIRPHGTGNFRHEEAMTAEEMQACLDLGAQWVDKIGQEGCNVLSLGEMGIGNTSPSSVWMHLMLNIPLEQCVGAGAGLNNEGIRHKYQVLKESIENCPLDLKNNENIIRYFGGFEMVTAIGAMLRAPHWKMTILVDGFIMTACALAASRQNPDFLQNAIFCHQGDEAGHRLMLEGIGVRGLLNLGLRLGEGTGAMCAYPIVESAVRMINEMNNFQNAQITKYF